MGVCWTTRRAIADWFANRSVFYGQAEPVLVTAHVKKEWVVAAKASEHEIVVMPPRPRRLKCLRWPLERRPEMQWSATSDA